MNVEIEPANEVISTESASLLRRVGAGLSVAIFVTVFASASRLPELPLRALVKDELGLPPEAMAQFFAIIGIPWYLKPIAGVLSDQVRLFGTRRKHYLMLGGLGGALVWCLSALGPLRVELLVAAMVLLNVMAVLGNTVAGGLLVEQARRHRATGKLSALRVVAMNAASLSAGPLGGWLAGRAFPLTCTIGAALMLAMVVVIALLLPADVEIEPSKPALRERLRGAFAQFRDRRLWGVIVFTGALYASPSFQILFYYHQRDHLGFSDQAIGSLIGLNCLGGMVGAACYGLWARRLRLDRSIVAGIGLYCACACAYLAYQSFAAALVIEPLAGFCLVLAYMPIHELSARASPPKHEAFGFAVILSVGNAAIALSDVLGTRLAKAFALDLGDMIFINIITMVASAGLLVLVPRSLLGKDGDCEEL